MRYIVRERIFSFADRFDITDVYETPVFQVEGKIFAIGNKLKIYDMDENELVYIEEQVFRFLPEYSIYRDGKVLGKVKKELTFFRPKFNIESILGNFIIDGDVFHYNFNIIKNGMIIANISKKWIAFSDTYSVDIEPSEDQSFILALVIILDQVLHDGNNKNNNI